MTRHSRAYPLTGRVVALTGASGGLGSGLAVELVARGASVALLDLDAREVAAQAETLGERARGYVADVRDLDQVTEVMREVASDFGRLDVAVAAAGISSMQPLLSTSPSKIEDVMNINFHGAWRTFRAALPHVQAQQGYLLAIASMAAFVQSPMQAPYAASKAAVTAMCNSLRLELRHAGVSVGSAHPGLFPTPMTEQVNRVGQILYGANPHGMWKMTTLEAVTTAIANGIEARRQQIVVPSSQTFLSRAPGLFRPLFERLGFPGDVIERAVRAGATEELPAPESPSRAAA